MWLIPSRRASSSPPPQHKAAAVDGRGGATYGAENLSNPEGLEPMSLPAELKALQTVPVVLTSVLSGSGRPSSVSAKLYVKAELPPSA